MNDTCATCADETGTKRYCALTRCYCGHSDCPAFDSWVDLKAIQHVGDTTSTTRSTAWADREDSTWIDKL